MPNKIHAYVLAIIFAIILVFGGGYYYGHTRYNAGYDAGYKKAYDIGYSEGYNNANALKEKEIADAVQAHSKTETKIVYQTIPYNGNDVQVHTEKPKVTVSVNGKKQEIQQKTETADLAVKTETAIKIKIPERRWKFGIGTDGKKPAFMLSAPVTGAVGVWVAGSTNKKIMGGVSVSF